ncbi:unnamed protein product [Arctogadus glacialis]
MAELRIAIASTSALKSCLPKSTGQIQPAVVPAERPDPVPDPRHSPASWRRPTPPSADSLRPGTSHDRGHKTAGVVSPREPWSSRGRGSSDQGEGRSGPGSRPWGRERQADRH